MNTIHRCTACLGSNFEEGKNMTKAIAKITHLFPDIQWGETIRTQAEDQKSKREYCNKAASFRTALPCEEITRLFKDIEKECGRTMEQKRKGIISIDIDLLTYGDTPIKPDDLRKQYVKQALKTLPSEKSCTKTATHF